MNPPNEPKPLGAEVESTTFKGVCNADEALARKVVATVLKLEEAAWNPVSHHIADYCDLIRTQRDYAETQCADMFEAIRALTAENATLRAERDELKAEITVITNCYCECGGTAKGEGGCTACQMYHEIADTFSKRNGVPRTDVSSNRSQCDTPTCPTCLERDQLKARVVELEGAMRHAVLHKVPDLTAQLAAANQREAELRAALEETYSALVRYEQDVDTEAPSAHRLMMNQAKAALAQAGGKVCVNCGIGFILPSGVCDHCDTKQAGGKEGV